MSMPKESAEATTLRSVPELARGTPPAPARPSPRPRSGRHIAYLSSMYPKVSHTFIRREIHALEALGYRISRLSVRPSGEAFVDPEDLAEVQHTRVLLANGPAGLIAPLMRAASRRPAAFARAAALAGRLSPRSEKGPLHHAAYLGEACLLREWLEEIGADHLHVHMAENPATVAMLCRQLGGPPWSLTVHGPPEFEKPGLIALKEKIASAELVFGVSHYGKSQLMRNARVDDWPKIHVVRCGLDDAFIDAPELPVPAAPRLVSVGRLCEQKAPHVLVEATARLVKAGVNLELVLVGDGELRGMVEQMIAQHGLGRHVTITGWANADKVRAEIEAARALVLPSFAEGLPVVLMEALALRRPVISTYIAGIPELVEPGRSGWLVPAGSVDDLVTAMREVLLASPERLLEMGNVGRRRALEMHDIRASADVLAELFEGLRAR